MSTDPTGLHAVVSALDHAEHILTERPGELAGQMAGRLLGRTSPAAQRLLAGAGNAEGPWLRPHTPHPTDVTGPMVRTLTDTWVDSVTFTADGTAVLAGTSGRDSSIYSWSPADGALLGRHPIERSTGRATVAAVPDGRAVVSRGHHRGAILIDTASGRIECEYDTGSVGEARSIAVSPDSRSVVLADDRGGQGVFDLAGGRRRGRFLDKQAGVDSWRAVAMTPDGRHIVSTAIGGSAQLWSVETGHLERTIDRRPPLPGRRWMDAVAMSPRGTLVAMGGTEGTIQLRRLPDGQRLGTLDTRQGEVEALAITPDGRHLVSGHSTGAVLIWGLLDRELLGVLRDTGAGINDLAVRSDGLVAVAAGDGLHLYDSGGAARVSISGGSQVYSLAVDSARGRAAAGHEDGSIKLWDIDEQAVITSFRAHRYPVSAVALSSDGSRAATGDEAGAVSVWELPSGRRQRSVLRPKGDRRGPVMGVAIDDSGEVAAAAAVGAHDYPRSKRAGLLRNGLGFDPPGAQRGRYAIWRGHTRLFQEKTWEWWACAFDPETDRVAVAGEYQSRHTVRVHDASTGEMVRVEHEPDGGFPTVGFGDRATVDDGYSVGSLGGDFVCSIRRGGKGRKRHTTDRIRVFDAQSGEVVTEYTLGLTFTALGSDSRTIVAADSSGVLHMFTLEGV